MMARPTIVVCLDLVGQLRSAEAVVVAGLELHGRQQLAADLLDRVFGGLLAEQRRDDQRILVVADADSVVQRLRQKLSGVPGQASPLGGWPMTSW